jgi:hypothetical protein
MSARVVRVGDLGTALTAMSPSGVVAIDGHRLDARSDGAAIPAGAAVVVLRGDPTGYVVREVGPEKPFPQLPDAGAEIGRPDFMRNSAEVRRDDARDEEERRRAWETATRARTVVAGLAGAAAGAGDAALAGHDAPAGLFAGGAVGLGTGFGLALLVGRLGPVLRWSPVAALTALLGGLVGAEAGFWVTMSAAVPPPVGPAVGGVLGLAAGGWVGRNIDVLGGPDAG